MKKRQNRGESVHFGPKMAAFGATENAIPRYLLGRWSPYFDTGHRHICAKSSRIVCTPDVSPGLRKSILEQKTAVFVILYAFMNNLRSRILTQILTPGMNSARDFTSDMLCLHS